MSAPTADRPRYWQGGTGDGMYLTAGCRPGDGVARHGSEAAWRGLRHQLAHRGLAVVSLGKRFFVAPQGALPQVPLLRQLAAAAAEDTTARAALKDLVEEVFGPAPGLAGSFAAACAAWPGKHLEVPGGSVQVNPGGARAHPPAAINAAAVRDLQRRTTKLSKLQRSLLAFVRDHTAPYHAAPLRLTRARTRAGAAALSRALRRLEQRGLLLVSRTPGGRGTCATLTYAGQQVLGLLTVTVE